MNDEINDFDENVVPEELTDSEKLIDFQKENIALRDAISDAWATYNKCQEALVEAQKQIADLLADVAYLKKVIKVDNIDMEL